MALSSRYDPHALEEKWQKIWAEKGSFNCDVDPSKPKYFLMEMFPYPSGNIHMGHVRNYSIGDVMARFRRLQGYNVLHPIGWDAFGLPAENAAIKHGTHPAKWTYANIDNMRSQLKRMGYSYDWRREIATCRPEYYRWEQEFFLKCLEKGLVYRKKAPQNWCPSCHTVLANEQVIDGKCWRCDSVVEQKDLTQWFFRITAYADELLADLKKLENGWPARVLTMQHNWIGRSTGAEIVFKLEGREGEIKVFSTRADTVFGVTFMTLAPEHPLVESLIAGRENEAEIRAFIERTRNMDRLDRQSETLEKDGVFTGAYCLNPFTGDRIPIWLGNFVLADYGTGAVMAVPAHDQRDFDFARKFGIGIKVVVSPDGKEMDPASMTEAYTEPGVLVNSGEFSGMPSTEGKAAIIKKLEETGKGRATVNYRLRDWNISRQRYWGAPIPVVYCEKCGVQPVKLEDLPVRLPLDVKTCDDGRSPLPHTPSFVETVCPCCGGPRPPRNRHHGHFRGIFLVLCALHVRPQGRRSLRHGGAQVLDARGSVHRRRGTRHSAPVVLPLLHQDAARLRLSARRHGRTLQESAHAGHGAARRQQDVQVQGQHRGSRCHGEEVRCRHGASVLPVRRAAGTRLRLE